MIANIVQPRWSWSATGILAVFLALAVIGSANMRLTAITKLTHAGAAAVGLCVLIAAATMAAQAWSRALALAAIAAGGLLLGCWGIARAGAVLDTRLFLGALDLLALLFAPLAVSAANAARAVRDGDDIATASARAIARKGPIAVVMAISGLVLLVPWYREVENVRVGLALALTYSAVAVLVFLPALTGVIDALVPRRRSIEERYRLK